MIDTVRLNLKAGNGGNGCTSFLREKYRPRGGPNGGDGGDGGNAFLVGDPSYNTLLHIKFNSTVYCDAGGHGKGKNKRGANGEDSVIPVPLGTVVWRLNRDGSKEFITDIRSETPVEICQGGKGGWGNARFATATNQQPVLSERGQRGEATDLFLELKLLADVGLLARPNAGKSTLISRCSAAKARVADYPFTTVEPVLGVVRFEQADFVMMEVPGLLEGAHEGVGLGHQFLRHAERARLYVHLLDGLSEDPVADYHMVNEELFRFNSALAAKPQLIVVNKLDVTEVREQSRHLATKLTEAAQEERKRGQVYAAQEDDTEVMFISAATGEGVDYLLRKIGGILRELPKDEEPAEAEAAPVRASRRERRPETVRVVDGVFIVDSEHLERLSALADTRDQRVLLQLWREMRKSGLAQQLVDAGIEVGDTIRLGRVEIEWF